MISSEPKRRLRRKPIVYSLIAVGALAALGAIFMHMSSKPDEGDTPAGAAPGAASSAAAPPQTP